MANLNILNSIRSVFSAITTVANVVERNANSLDNLSRLGEVYTGGLVKEQELIQKKRLAELEIKAEAKYKAEQAQWKL